LLDYHSNTDSLRIIEVVDHRYEAEEVKSLFFRDSQCRGARPGQYIMVWIPGIDEVPMSLSRIDEQGISSITFKRVGEGTDALYKTVSGEPLGIRGPYGNWFQPVKGKCLIIGGGTGLASLFPLLKKLVTLGSSVTCVYGAKTAQELLFRDDLTKLLSSSIHQLILTTEDGSYGKQGVVTSVFQDSILSESFDMVYTCGPEPMMRTIFTYTEPRGLPIQACIERMVKCSIGVCGSCTIGEYRVCKEGLILSTEKIRQVLDEFGVYERAGDGWFIDSFLLRLHDDL
jgi:dihydroorotate dehydrogenase electron transfer subunit